MASTRFIQVAGEGRQRKYLVEEKRFPSHLPQRPQLSSEEIMQLKPGAPGYFPSGVDQKAPRQIHDR